MQLEHEFCANPKVRSPAPDPEEEVRIFGLTGSQYRPVSDDNCGLRSGQYERESEARLPTNLHEVVKGQTVCTAEPTITTSK